MLATNTTRVICDFEQNSSASDMPLYAVLKDGEFEIIDPHDIEDTPCYTFTPAGREEVLDNYHTHEWLMDALAKRGIDTAWMDEA